MPFPDGIYLTIFLIDGCSQRVFQEELDAGNLPELDRLRDEGAWVKNGIASFPSMTGYGYYPFLTGRNAIDSGILGLRWFDRSRTVGNARNYVGRTHVLLNRDVAPWPPTLFEQVDPAYTTSINCFMNRGVKNHLLTDLSFSVAKFRDHLWLTQKLDEAAPALSETITPDWSWVERRVSQLAIDDLPFLPKIQWITFASADGYHHTFGFDETYRRLLQEIDREIGTYRQASVEQDQEKDRIYAVVTDHGVTPVSRHFDTVSWLAELGLSIFLEPAAVVHDERLLQPIETYDDYDGTLCINGDTIALLYLARKGLAGQPRWAKGQTESALRSFSGTKITTPFDVVSALADRPEIELVILRGGADEGFHPVVVVCSGDGRAEIRRIDSMLQYRVTHGADPLSQGELAEGWTSKTELDWIDSTIEKRFPAAVPRLHALFTDPNMGDLLLIAAPDYDLAPDYEPIVGNFKGGHGGLSADQTRVSYLLCGPGVAPGSTINAARAEDIGATLHRLLDVPLAAPKDDRTTGRILEEILLP